MSEKKTMLPCPHCGMKVYGAYDGSSEWTINHLDDKGAMIENYSKCISPTIWVRATTAQWKADENAEWNLMADKWNRRAEPDAGIPVHEVQ